MRCVRCHALFRQLPLILYHLYQMSFVDYTAEWSAVNPFVFDSSICLLKKITTLLVKRSQQIVMVFV